MFNKIESVDSLLYGKVMSLIVTLAVVGTMLVPFALVYAASSSYSFTMVYRVVDGCANDEFHYLDAGTVKISGSTSSGSSQDIYYELWRERFGPDKSFGTINGGINQSFTETFPDDADIDSSNYCLEMNRASTDPYTVTGSGTVYNN